jgi:hypothetical protein
MFKESHTVQDELEDKLRLQLEQSDLVQGFQVSADVTTGHGSFTKILVEEFMRDEAPKAPVLLYAIEKENPYNSGYFQTKKDLYELNRSLWLGDLLPSVDMAVPFDSEFMRSDKFFN